jgi:hypothetical protein
MTTESREVFKTVFKTIYPYWIKFERDGIGYQSPLVDSGFKIWQAGIEYGREQALEEQATEIAELKTKLADAIQDAHREAQELDRVNAKLAEVMPLAKFGATLLRTYAHNGDINEEQVYNAAMQTNCMHATKAFTVLSPNTVDTIIKLLKD